MKNEENSGYFEELKKRLEVNIYPRDKIEDALKVIKKKKFACFKLITNAGGEEKSGKELIEKAREIVRSNFVCLVFSI